MSIYKNYLVMMLIGGLGGVLFSGFLMPFLARHNVAGFGSFLNYFGDKVVIKEVHKETVISPESGYFSEALGKIEPSLVAVQSFGESRVIRFAAGAVLTQDGIILTLNSAVPLGSAYHQVWLGDGPVRAEVVYRDWTENLALVKVEDKNLPVVYFQENIPALADGLLMAGKVVDLNKVSMVIDPAIVTRAGDGVFDFKADYSESLFGALLIDGQGKILGIVDFKNKQPVLKTPETIQGILGLYLEGIE